MPKLASHVILMLGLIMLVTPTKAIEKYTPKYISDSIQICVERLEDEGSLNIVPVTIVVTDNSSLTLLGGEAGCLIVPNGTQSINLSYPYPYSDLKNPRRWTTSKQFFKAEKNTISSFELCEAANQRINDPHWMSQGWHNMWVLRRMGQTPNQQCAVAN